MHKKAPSIFSPHRARRALTIVEIVVALLVMSLLFASVGATFVVMMRTTQEIDIQTRSVANARAALEYMSSEIKAAQTPFVGINGPELPYGDAFDDDRDGGVDEETRNGLDDDGDWADRHLATNATLIERPLKVGIADLGDAGVDEDCRWQLDEVRYRVPSPGDPTWLYEDVYYRVDSFEGEDNVLLRDATRVLSGGAGVTTTTAPLAYDVMDFNVLYWNPNAPAGSQYWVPDWSSASPPGPANTFDLPATLLLTVGVYADPRPINAWTPGTTVEVITMHTAVNIESVILDASFPRP